MRSEIYGITDLEIEQHI